MASQAGSGGGTEPRAGPPGRDDLERQLGPAFEAFELLSAGRPAATTEWRRYSKAAPWTLKVIEAKRTLCYLTPTDEGLHVSVIFGAKATEAVLAADDVPDHVKTALREARQYAEGRGIRLAVETAADVGLIERLVSLKLAPSG